MWLRMRSNYRRTSKESYVAGIESYQIFKDLWWIRRTGETATVAVRTI